MNTRDVTFLLLLGISTHATAKEPSSTPSNDTGRAPSLLIHEVVKQTRTGTEPVPVETPLQPGQSIAISLQASGFVQVVEERTGGQTAFLSGGKVSPATRRSGARRIPGVGWLRIGADAKTICVVVSNKPLQTPSCSEESDAPGRGEDKTPPSPQSEPKETKKGKSPQEPNSDAPPVKDNDKTRTPDDLRMVIKIPVSSE